MKIVLLAGARPNFIKAAPLWKAFRKLPDVQLRLIHTGQQRDAAMSAALLRELDLPEPDLVLGEGNGQTTVQESTRIMLGLEPAFQEWRPDWVVVIGDVTSTLAGTLTAKYMGFRVAHVEAGLRSGDRSMPEELNRIAVDHLADAHFASEPAAMENLRREGLAHDRVVFSGNVLIDALSDAIERAKHTDLKDLLSAHFRSGSAGIPFQGAYAVLTFHRPSNVDTPEGLRRIAELVRLAARRLPVLFPIHPRTWNKLQLFDLDKTLTVSSNIVVLPPLGYTQMAGLLRQARLIVTDSGGLQEESTWLGIPCLTFRTHTERPATIETGTNTLVDDLNPETVDHLIGLILAGQYKSGGIPPLWDGHAATRIAEQLTAW